MERTPRIVKFVRVELKDKPANRCVAHVELMHQSGTACVGTVEGGCAPEATLMSAAQATAQALLQAVGTGEDLLDIAGVELSQPIGRPTVFASVSAYYFRQRRELVGCCLVDGDPARAAALAVLNATNRFLGIG